WRERRQLCCVSANFIGLGRCPACVDLHVAADAPAGLLETLQEGSKAGLKFPIVRSRGQENANEAHAFAVLSARRERPRGRRTSDERDELAAPHSITSSARASSVCGISRPSALAVLRLRHVDLFLTGRVENVYRLSQGARRLLHFFGVGIQALGIH